MRVEDERSGKLFSYVDLEARVRCDHPLRGILMRDELERIGRSRSARHRPVRRAQIVLPSARGESNTAIAERLGVSNPTICHWRKKWFEQGIVGLYGESALAGREPTTRKQSRSSCAPFSTPSRSRALIEPSAPQRGHGPVEEHGGAHARALRGAAASHQKLQALHRSAQERQAEEPGTWPNRRQAAGATQVDLLYPPAMSMQQRPLTQRQENFVRKVAEGMPASRAYRDAGFAASSGNSAEVLASRTLRKVQVAARLAELRAEQAKRHEVTIDSLAREFDENRAHALRVDQVGAAVQATAMKAKLFGFMVDRQQVQVEHTLRKPSADENAPAEMSLEDWQAKYGGSSGPPSTAAATAN